MNRLLFIVVGAVLFFIYQIANRETRSAKTLKKNRITNVAEKADNSPARELSLERSNVPRDSNHRQLEFSLGVERVSGKQVRIRTVPKKRWCQLGDLDTIRAASEEHPPQITIESLDQRKTYFKRTLKTDPVAQSFVFKTDKLSVGENVGIFICSSKQKRCQGGNYQSSTHAKKNKSNIFFFQYLHHDERGLAVPRTFAKSEAQLQDLQNY